MLPAFEDPAQKVLHMHRLCKIRAQIAELQSRKEVGEEETPVSFDERRSISP